MLLARAQFTTREESNSIDPMQSDAGDALVQCDPMIGGNTYSTQSSAIAEGVE